jgi:hypothetical protein
MNRPDTDAQDQLSKSSFSACNGRPVHTEGPEAVVRHSAGADVRSEVNGGRRRNVR